MSWKKANLYFADLALLYILNDHFETTGSTPTKEALMDDLWNVVMEMMGAIDEGYAQPVTSSQRFEVAIRSMRALGLVEPQGKFLLTPKGRTFVQDHLTLSDWRNWPVMIPIRGNVLLLKEAQHMED